jgi:hypothetical protein
MSVPLPNSEIILYQTEDGRTRIQCRFENETLWLTQALISELFQVTVPTVNEHLKGIYAEGELAAKATIRKFRIVRTEGNREVAREIEHYNLDAILAVGFRVRSHRGTQFRQWAIGRLNEYLAETLRARVAGPRRKNLRRAVKNKSRAGIPALSVVPRYTTPPRGRPLRASHQTTPPISRSQTPEEKEVTPSAKSGGRCAVSAVVSAPRDEGRESSAISRYKPLVTAASPPCVSFCDPLPDTVSAENKSP